MNKGKIIMKYRFKKNITAFKTNHYVDEIIELDHKNIETLICLNNGWIEEYNDRVIKNRSTKAIRRKK